MKHSYTHIQYFITSVILCFISFSSCQMGEQESELPEVSALKFNLCTAQNCSDPVLTKAMTTASVNGTQHDFEIVCSEEEAGVNLGSEMAAETKAVTIDAVTQSDFATNGFGLYGFDKNNTKVIDGVLVTVSGTTGTPSTTYQWSRGATMSFVGYYPKKDIFSNAAASGAWTFNYTVPTTATTEEDLLLSYYSGKGTEGSADLSFSHPLTCVKFKLGDIQEKLGGITSIKLNGVYASGTCTVTPSGNSLTYSWAGSGSADVAASGNESLGVGKALGSDFTFIVIPQALSTKHATIEMTCTRGETFALELSSGEWKSGKINTYTISANLVCSIDVDDNVDNLVKSNVVIKNTGTASSFVRASISANWTDSTGDIIAPWTLNLSDTGFSGLPGNGWEYDSTDGFFYYTSPVAANQELKTANNNALFNSYTAHDIPAVGAQLQMMILVQAIEYNSSMTYKTVWN